VAPFPSWLPAMVQSMPVAAAPAVIRSDPAIGFAAGSARKPLDACCTRRGTEAGEDGTTHPPGRGMPPIASPAGPTISDPHLGPANARASQREMLMSPWDERLEDLPILWRRRQDLGRGGAGLRNQDPDRAGDAIDVDLTKAQAYVRSLHLAPGEPVPESFEECPVCEGAGCVDCDECGRVHPQRAKWLDDALRMTAVPLWVLEQVLARPDLPAPARRRWEWIERQAEAAEQLLNDWAGASPDLARVVEGAGWRRTDDEDPS
jgi:hypothetical protein